jgi:hypothetical protein
VLSRRAWIAVSAVAGLLLTLGAVAAARIPFSSQALRDQVVEGLSERLDADVELGGLTMRLLPRLRAQGSSLAVYHKGRRDLPPMIAVKAFTVDAGLLNLWRMHVSRVTLEGLQISIPPGNTRRELRAERAERDATKAPDARDANDETPPGDAPSLERQVVIDELLADDATLTILRRDPAKPSRVWALHTLRMTSVGATQAMPFTASITNAIPPGQVDTEGAFGPYNRDDPGQSPILGAFTFNNADLGVFKGIAGTLSSKGTYGGTLDTLEARGETTTPNFSLTMVGQEVPLTATYHAVIDATNGETRLERVEAKVLETSFVATGGVFEVEGVKGREVRVDVDMKGGRIEDMMRLAVKAPQPPMTGTLTLEAKLLIPPGPVDVVEKIRLDGVFNIEGGRFTDVAVQRQVTNLSRKASGTKDEQPHPRVTSDFSAKFTMAEGRLRLNDLTFDIPGAIVALDGRYDLRQGTLTFAGNLYMDAKVSQMASGFKSLLLRAVDPIFRKEGRTVIPIKVSGTRDNPKFGLDAKRVF